MYIHVSSSFVSVIEVILPTIKMLFVIIAHDVFDWQCILSSLGKISEASYYTVNGLWKYLRNYDYWEKLQNVQFHPEMLGLLIIW